MRNSSASSGRKAKQRSPVPEARIAGRVVQGRVLRGEGTGRKVGYPTANLSPRLRRRAKDGIYACHVWLKRKQFDGVAVVGVPGRTGVKKFEVHLIRFRGNLYGKTLSLNVIRRIRGLKRFRTVASLRAQIRRDLSAACRIFASL